MILYIEIIDQDKRPQAHRRWGALHSVLLAARGVFPIQDAAIYLGASARLFAACSIRDATAPGCET